MRLCVVSLVPLRGEKILSHTLKKRFLLPLKGSFENSDKHSILLFYIRISPPWDFNPFFIKAETYMYLVPLSTLMGTENLFVTKVLKKLLKKMSTGNLTWIMTMGRHSYSHVMSQPNKLRIRLITLPSSCTYIVHLSNSAWKEYIWWNEHYSVLELRTS